MPSKSSIISTVKGRHRQRGGALTQKWPVFRSKFGRRSVRGSGRSPDLTGDGLFDILKAAWPYLKRVPEFFKTRIARKMAGSLASSGLSTGINIIGDRMAKKGPLKEVVKQRTAESAKDLLQKAKDSVDKKVAGMGRGRRGRRRRRRTGGGCRRKPIKRAGRRRKRTVGGARRRGKKKTGRSRKKRALDIFD